MPFSICIGANTLTTRTYDPVTTIAGAAFLVLLSGAATTQANASGVSDSTCVFEASLSEGADASYTFAGKQGGLVLTLDENGYTGIRFLGDSEDFSNRTMMMWRFDEPLPLEGTGPTSTTINASMGSSLDGQSFGSRDMSNGELLAPLEVDITQREPISAGDENAVRMAGTVQGEVSAVDRPNPPVTASLNISFHGSFSFRPPGPYTLNCDSISY